MIPTAKASDVTISGALVIVIVIDAIFTWLPLGVYRAVPEGTAGNLQAVNASLQAHSHLLTAVLLTVVGVVLIGNGIYGLA